MRHGTPGFGPLLTANAFGEGHKILEHSAKTNALCMGGDRAGEAESKLLTCAVFDHVSTPLWKWMSKGREKWQGDGGKVF